MMKYAQLFAAVFRKWILLAFMARKQNNYIFIYDAISSNVARTPDVRFTNVAFMTRMSSNKW